MTPYHPQGNGLVERTNRTIKGILQGFCKTLDADRWDETLPLCMLAYRASYHSTTEYSPAFLTLGRELRLPVEIAVPSLPNAADTTLAYTRDLEERLQQAFQHVREHAGRMQEQQKRVYDREIHGNAYNVGDRVWLHRPRPPQGTSTKFHPPWQSPYEVVYQRSPTVYTIRKIGS
ncbi:unnamed protein product [Echinostoma caproni]|uniref:Integrase catalytic domain-containing protein n=1 Tax=Echinostoma caproni TaxID=27848 RepID=A0A183ALV2_9TREM|nr:unnamed protein product [Echinostoma caproni]